MILLFIQPFLLLKKTPNCSYFLKYPNYFHRHPPFPLLIAPSLFFSSLQPSPSYPPPTTTFPLLPSSTNLPFLHPPPTISQTFISFSLWIHFRPCLMFHFFTFFIFYWNYFFNLKFTSWKLVYVMQSFLYFVSFR